MKIRLPFTPYDDAEAWLFRQLMSHDDRKYLFRKHSKLDTSTCELGQWSRRCAEIFDRVLGPKYTKTLDALISDGLVQVDHSYKVGAYARSYRIPTDVMDKQLVLHELTNKKILKNVADETRKATAWIRNYATDTDRQENALCKKVWKDLLAEQMGNEAFQDWLEIVAGTHWRFHPRVSDSSAPQRVYHPLINLDNSLKPLRLLDGEQLVSIDLHQAWTVIAFMLFVSTKSKQGQGSQGKGTVCSNSACSDLVISLDTEQISSACHAIALADREILAQLLQIQCPIGVMPEKFKKQRCTFLCDPHPLHSSAYQEAAQLVSPAFGSFVLAQRGVTTGPLWQQLEAYESHLMRRCLYPRLSEAGIDWISEHDGAAVRVSQVEQACAILSDVLSTETNGLITFKVKKASE